MKDIEWFWPYDNEKDCWLSAMALLYEGEYTLVEVRVMDEWMIYKPKMLVNPFGSIKTRPLHKSRWLVDKYKDGQKWQKKNKNARKKSPKWLENKCFTDDDREDIIRNRELHGGWSDFKEYKSYYAPFCMPTFEDGYEYRPHPIEEPELYKWYEENNPFNK